MQHQDEVVEHVPTQELGQIPDKQQERSPWQTPEVVQLQIKRTMFGSNAGSDGNVQTT